MEFLYNGGNFVISKLCLGSEKSVIKLPFWNNEKLSNVNVEIIIFDNSGKKIQTLGCNYCQTGKNVLQWNCFDKTNNRVQSGVYFYEVHFGTEIQAKKMIIIGGRRWGRLFSF